LKLGLTMSRSTPEDEIFKRRVAEEFNRARDRAIAQGFSVDHFAGTLGITRAGLHKYLTGRVIPSLRVLREARRRWDIRLSYGELGDGYVKVQRQDSPQMELQFSIEDLSKEQIHVAKFSPKGVNSAELVIRIDFSKSA